MNWNDPVHLQIYSINYRHINPMNIVHYYYHHGIKNFLRSHGSVKFKILIFTILIITSALISAMSIYYVPSFSKLSIPINTLFEIILMVYSLQLLIVPKTPNLEPYYRLPIPNYQLIFLFILDKIVIPKNIFVTIQLVVVVIAAYAVSFIKPIHFSLLFKTLLVTSAYYIFILILRMIVSNIIVKIVLCSVLVLFLVFKIIDPSGFFDIYSNTFISYSLMFFLSIIFMLKNRAFKKIKYDC